MRVNHKLYNKYKAALPSRTPDKIKEIVYHGTAGGANAQAVIDWMLSGEREEEYKKGIALFHYLIGYDGTIHNLLPDLAKTFHSSSGKHDNCTIAIELMNKKKDNSGKYTDDQYESLKVLTYMLLSLYPITTITSHSRNAETFSHIIDKDPPCPGPAFDWNKVASWLKENNLNYRTNDEDYIYEISRRTI